MQEFYLQLLDIPIIRDALKASLNEQQARDPRFQLPIEIQRLTRLVNDFETLDSEWEYKISAIVEQCPSCKVPLKYCERGSCEECGDSDCPTLVAQTESQMEAQ